MTLPRLHSEPRRISEAQSALDRGRRACQANSALVRRDGRGLHLTTSTHGATRVRMTTLTHGRRRPFCGGRRRVLFPGLIAVAWLMLGGLTLINAPGSS